MDIYFVKQPQNIIIKVKMKEYEIEKEQYRKKVEWNVYYCLYFVCETVTCPALFASGKADQSAWYEFSAYLHH